MIKVINEKTKQRLEQKIKEGTIMPVEITPDKLYWCCFCDKMVDNNNDKIYRLIEEVKIKGRNAIHKYYSHIGCYKTRLIKHYRGWVVESSLN